MAHKKIQGAGTVKQRRQLLDIEAAQEKTLSRSRQCQLLGLQRSGTYSTPIEAQNEKEIREAIDKAYQTDPCLGARRLPAYLEKEHGIKIGRKKVLRVKKDMGLRTIYQHPKTSRPGKRGKEGKHPYLLKELEKIQVDDVWTSDITYLQIGAKNYYLCVVMDWASRYVLGWSLSDKMDITLCLRALEMALSRGRIPKYFNTDQGSQYTSRDWQECMEENGIIISQDSKGRWADNIVMERLWRTYKYEFFFIHEPSNLIELEYITAKWIDYYNNKRPHTSLENKTPAEYRREQGIPTPHPANFFSDFSAPVQLASLRSAPSLRSGRRTYATKSLKKWIDKHTLKCY